MRIITSREFRANQRKYFEIAENETVLIMRRNAKPVVINVATDEDLPSPSELVVIQRGLDDIRNGRTYKKNQNESFDDFFKRMETCI
jgi:PHD/YefM family antitoxin component YafN of YafNO toxin-antitoxin module